MSGADSEKARRYVKRSLLTWLRAVWLIDDKVTNNIGFSCSGAHINVRMIPGAGVSFAGAGRANIYEQKPYGEYLHEFGHAFSGLSDTYSGRQAGACRAGQPQSNMCWGAYGPRRDPEKFSGLWEDDIKGIQAQHRKIFGSMNPPGSAGSVNAEQPLDENNPWPLSGNGQTPQSGGGTPQRKIYIALESVSADEGHFLIGVESDITAVSLCVRSETKTCSNDLEGVSALYVRTVNDRKIFRAPTSFNYKDASIRVWVGSGAGSTTTLQHTENFKLKSVSGDR